MLSLSINFVFLGNEESFPRFPGSHHALAFPPNMRWKREREKGRSAERWSAPLVFMNSGATGLPASDLISKPPILRPVTFLLRFSSVARPSPSRFSRSAVTSSSYHVNNWPRYRVFTAIDPSFLLYFLLIPKSRLPRVLFTAPSIVSPYNLPPPSPLLFLLPLSPLSLSNFILLPSNLSRRGITLLALVKSKIHASVARYFNGVHVYRLYALPSFSSIRVFLPLLISI